MNLPAELAMLLSACDGTVDTSALDRDPDEYDPGLFVAQHHLLPLTEIGAVRSTAGSTKEFWGAWIPVAVADYALAPWSGLAIDPDGRLAEFSLADGEPPSPLAAPGYRTLTEFIEALAEVLTQDTGPLAGGVIPGLHRGALVWGPLPGDGAPWMPVQPQVGPTA
ncbi:hypothetical protein ACH41E_04280 [Streptomyces sp. NPDC020412]|uniref:hypothetical protein n=1 Tax=Streptomyces sp. NPDC020412 TaxID=3365073 RepID=UPI00379E850E